MTLHLAASALSALARACDLAFPREACGFLLGEQCENLMASEVVIAGDSPNNHDSFEIPDCELRRIAAYAEDRALRIVALFHSHPSGDCELSAADGAALRHSAWPWAIITRASKTSKLVVTCYASGDATTIAVCVNGDLM
jgi:proteasome lid subunit RPN8/RPN11